VFIIAIYGNKSVMVFS